MVDYNNKIKLYNKETKQEETFYMPNIYLITSNNNMFDIGFCNIIGFSFNNIFDLIKNDFTNNIGVNTLNSELLKDEIRLFKILKNKNIDIDDFNSCLTNKYIPILDNNKKSNDRILIDIIKSILETKIDIYKFFIDIKKYTDDYNKMFDNIMNICQNDIFDVLVRCCNIAKIETTQFKTITTSDLNANYRLKEYINNGYSICNIPPIKIDKENKTIVEYSYSDIRKNTDDYSLVKMFH